MPNLFLPALLFLTSLLLFSCEPLEDVVEDEETTPIEWQGASDTVPLNPEVNWFYYNTDLERTLIFNGEIWDTMSVDGLDGASIEWLGSFETAPEEFKDKSTYFNKTDSISYIYNATLGQWDTLSCSGKDGISLQWKGDFPAHPESPELNWAYHNTIDNASYIYTSAKKWEPFAVDGINGIDIAWQGSFKTAPAEPFEGMAYYDETESMSFVWSGGEWKVIAKDGLEGKDGTSLIWKGEFADFPAEPHYLWAFYHSVNGNSYICDENLEWQILARAGENGISIVWLGTHDTIPLNVTFNNAYFNSVSGNSYIFDGADWQILCKAGEKGTDGEKGADGSSIVWLGALSKHPDIAKENNAYFNYTDKKSYLFDGKFWHIIAESGSNGISLNWRGDWLSAPFPANEYDAYFNTSDSCSYIYARGKWDLLSKSGSNGKDGQSITWYAYKPTYPVTNDVYYDSKAGITFIYNGTEWDVFCRDGKDGKDAEELSKIVRGFIEHGDTLFLEHNMNKDKLTVTAQYYTAKNVVYTPRPGSYKPGWSSSYSLDTVVNLYTGLQDNQYRDLFKLKNGSLLHFYIQSGAIGAGAKYALLTETGLAETKTLTENSIYNPRVTDLADGTLVFSYIDLDDDRKAKIVIVAPDGTRNEVVVNGASTKSFNMVMPNESTYLFSYVDSNGRGCFRRMSAQGTLSPEQLYTESVESSSDVNELLLLADGNTLLVYKDNIGLKSAIIDENDAVLYSENIGDRRTVYSVARPVQAADGSIYLTCTYVNDTEILKLTAQGSLITSASVAEEVQTAQLAVQGNAPVVLYVQKDHLAGSDDITGFSYVAKFDENLNCDFTNRLIETITYPRMVLQEDGKLGFTYIHKAAPANVSYRTLTPYELTPSIEVVALDSHTCCMINNSGRTLEMVLSVYLNNRSADDKFIYHLSL